MKPIDRTIAYGGEQVPLLGRLWKRRKAMTPYYRTDLLRPGENWRDAPTTGAYTEHYVQLAEGVLPVGVLIARELRDHGATVAVLTDLTLGRLRLIDTDLVCVEPRPPLSELLQRLRAANRGRWAGLPDSMAIFSDGRVALRERKSRRKTG
jgi:hypothetical protein